MAPKRQPILRLLRSNCHSKNGMKASTHFGVDGLAGNRTTFASVGIAYVEGFAIPHKYYRPIENGTRTRCRVTLHAMDSAGIEPAVSSSFEAVTSGWYGHQLHWRWSISEQKCRLIKYYRPVKDGTRMRTSRTQSALRTMRLTIGLRAHYYIFL